MCLSYITFKTASVSVAYFMFGFLPMLYTHIPCYLRFVLNFVKEFLLRAFCSHLSTQEVCSGYRTIIIKP